MSKSLSIVVDADIARASGTSEHPVSSSSREVLESISKNGHKVAICPALLSEWKKHRSIFAKRWLSSMIARRKVKFIDPKEQTKRLIAEHITDPRAKSIAEKDSHLVDAALLTDNIITSNDAAARGVFCDLSEKSGIIRNIIWFNSISDKEFVSEYFDRIVIVPEKYFLGVS